MYIINKIINREIQPNSFGFKKNLISSREFVEALQYSRSYKGHSGCVNTICWNSDASLLASGSDDRCIILWSADGEIVQKIQTLHLNNIFTVRFLPETKERFLVSGAGDSNIYVHDLTCLKEGQVQEWNLNGRVKKIATSKAESYLFWSACEDGILREHDIRCSTPNVLVDLSPEMYEIKSLAINDNFSQMIALALNDAMVPIYDRRYLKTPLLKCLPGYLSTFTQRSRRTLKSSLVTSVAFNQKGNELLVNKTSDGVYIFNLFESDCESTPNVCRALHNYISSEANTKPVNAPKENTEVDFKVFTSLLNYLKSIQFDIESLFFHSYLTAFENFRVLNFFTESIDLCSTLIDNYLSNKNICPVFFHKSPRDFFKTISNSCGVDFAYLLMQRGSILADRNVMGDSMSALCDFLQALEIIPGDPFAEYWVSVLLIKQEQMDLANKINSTSKYFDRLVREFRQRYPMEKLGLPLTEERYGRFKDYVTRFIGAANYKTDIKEAIWFGGHDEMIVAGSDCGNFFIWERRTQKVLKVFSADEYAVNCIQSHPRRLMLATCGIDSDIKIWEPVRNPKLEDKDRDKTYNKYEIICMNLLNESVYQTLTTWQDDSDEIIDPPIGCNQM